MAEADQLDVVWNAVSVHLDQLVLFNLAGRAIRGHLRSLGCQVHHLRVKMAMPMLAAESLVASNEEPCL